MRVPTLSLLALLAAAGCSGESQVKPSCEEACMVCNMSNNALRKRFESTQVPKRFLFAMPYVDDVSYKTYMQCIDEAVQKKTTADALGCTKRADKVCVEACKNGS
jgi:hypothetical protein